ncbi:DUF2238 domain-containing protein [Falsibacillus albus]|uniref:DUF2238 domain-containing protein n=1 Tax=Falsibacillus albus TaxID=2478915 RepID=A0A3L7K6B5_9BACI|nr:DUF2238 domain-containing protein [Falsibacillus albus]RLQ96242.1 DUF2238 domain-containing protein [Falsibacillus albus]
MHEKGVQKLHVWLLVIVISVLIWSAIKPLSYLTWTLEVTPAVIGILILLITYRKFTFTSLVYVLISILVIWMFIGGHYTYERVPLFTEIKNNFHLKRNDYDRVGHFLKGLISIAIREVFIRKSCLNPSWWLIFVTLSVVLALSAGYEIIEWLAAVILGKEAHDFLGTQGDIWDSEWDMMLAFCGGIISLLSLSKIHQKFLMKIL